MCSLWKTLPSYDSQSCLCISHSRVTISLTKLAGKEDTHCEFRVLRNAKKLQIAHYEFQHLSKHDFKRWKRTVTYSSPKLVIMWFSLLLYLLIVEYVCKFVTRNYSYTTFRTLVFPEDICLIDVLFAFRWSQAWVQSPDTIRSNNAMPFLQCSTHIFCDTSNLSSESCSSWPLLPFVGSKGVNDKMVLGFTFSLHRLLTWIRNRGHIPWLKVFKGKFERNKRTDHRPFTNGRILA